MARVKFGKVTRSRRKRWIKRAKGYYGLKKNSYKKAHEQVVRSMAYAFIGRKEKKRNFRKLWIVRINAAVRPYNLSYSKFMFGLKNANIDINRKMLSELAINNPLEFEKIVNIVQTKLNIPEIHLELHNLKLPKTKNIINTLENEKVDIKSKENLKSKKTVTKEDKTIKKTIAKSTTSNSDNIKKTVVKTKKSGLTELEESKTYLKNIEKQFAKELKPLLKIDENGNPIKKITKKMSTEERSSLDNSNLISENRDRLIQNAEIIRSNLNLEDKNIFVEELTLMTTRELIKYMRKIVNKIAKYEK